MTDWLLVNLGDDRLFNVATLRQSDDKGVGGGGEVGVTCRHREVAGHQLSGGHSSLFGQLKTKTVPINYKGAR